MDIYREQLLDHYNNPRHWGLTKQATTTKQGFNPLCGDQVTVELDIKEGIVTDMHFEGNGCAISLAAASILSEHIIGQSVEKIKSLAGKDIKSLLGVDLQPTRLKCGLLALETVRKALDNL